MEQYRKKPVVIDAEQFFYDGPRVRGVFYPDVSEDGRTWIGDAFVVTIHGQRVYLQSGDWIIAEPDGEHYYPVKPDIFAATYDPVEGDMFARGEMASSPATPGIEPAPYFTLNADRDLKPETEAALGEVARAVYVNHLEATNNDLRQQLAECQAKLAAIPLAALRRSFYTGYSSDAQVEDDEIAIAAWLEVQPEPRPENPWMHGEIG